MFPGYLYAPQPDVYPSYPFTMVQQSPLWWGGGGYRQPYSKYPFAKLLLYGPGWFPSGHDPFVVQTPGFPPGADYYHPDWLLLMGQMPQQPEPQPQYSQPEYWWGAR
jgi:hypothetical protein